MDELACKLELAFLESDHPEAVGRVGQTDRVVEFGEALQGRILVFTRPKGGVAASWSLADLQQRGLAPAGIVFHVASPIFVQGALSAGLPIIDQLDGDPCELIRSGDEVALFPREGRLEVYR